MDSTEIIEHITEVLAHAINDATDIEDCDDVAEYAISCSRYGKSIEDTVLDLSVNLRNSRLANEILTKENNAIRKNNEELVKENEDLRLKIFNKEAIASAAKSRALYEIEEMRKEVDIALEYLGVDRRKDIVLAFLRERDRQDGLWGGIEHDNQHNEHEWGRFINEYTEKAVQMRGDFHPDIFVENMIKIAALALAATEAAYRKESVVSRVRKMRPETIEEEPENQYYKSTRVDDNPFRR